MPTRAHEELLIKTGALQHAIFNSANFSSIATDEKGVIQLFNVGAERMLGYAAGDVLNRITPADISDPDEVIARAAALSAELGTPITPGFEALVFKASRGIEDIYELTYIRKDGTRLPAIVSVTALREAAGGIIGYLLIGTDNTARTHVESERKRIEQMLQDKNLELEQAKLAAEQTVERLEEVERLKQGFLSTVSHELRTPLTSIKGSLGLLASGVLGALSSEAIEVVGIAERNAVRLSALVNDILDLERLETGRIELQFARVQVEEILRRAIESLATLEQNQGVTVEAPRVSMAVWADADRILQVLVNLLSNAVKFSPPGGVVTIAVARSGTCVEFRVTDRGRGIPAEHRRPIFERFRQVETSDAREKGGSGLGLAICKSIVEQHGGTLGVESEVGAGSTFWFRVAEAVAPALGAPRPHALHVLIVEDEPTLVEVMSRQLARDGIAVRTAATGVEAIRSAAAETPAMMVLDVGLPVSDGFAVIQAMRAQPALAGLPVLVYTGLDLTEEQRGRLRLGPTRFLTKSRASDGQFSRLVLELLRQTPAVRV